MQSHYKTSLGQLKTIANEERKARKEIEEIENKLLSIQSRSQSLATYLKNEADFIGGEEGQEILNAIKELVGNLPKGVSSSIKAISPNKPKVSQPKDNFNRSAYTLNCIGNLSKKTFTAADVVECLQSSEYAHYFTSKPSTYAALHKFVKRNILKRKGDKYTITEEGTSEIQKASTEFKKKAIATDSNEQPQTSIEEKTDATE